MPGRRVEILKRIEEGEALPSLSPLTVRLIETASDESCTVRDISDLIGQDPSLTTRVLKLCNSVFYAQRTKVSTLSRAVVLLGIERVRSIALGLSLRDTFPLGVQGGMDYDGFWKISLYRALIAHELALKIGEIPAEEAFVAALILEIGQLMLYTALSPEERGSYPRGRPPTEQLLQWERNALAIDHREAGRIILTKWRFPARLIEVQSFFGTKAFHDEASPLARLCELARLGSETLFTEGNSLYALHKNGYKLYHVTPHAINDILIDAIMRMEQTASAMELESDKEKDLLAVMERANQALQKLNFHMAGQIQMFLDRAESQFGSGDSCSYEQIAQARDKAIESALQAVAHEIRNPLLSLGGFVHRLSKTGAVKSEYISMILQEASRIDHVLHELSDFSRHYQPDFHAMNLSLLAEEALEEFRQPIKEKNVSVVKQYDPDDVPDIYLDTTGMKRVLAQFIGNAVHSINDTDGRLVLTIQTHRSRDEVSVSIEDNGAPFDDSVLPVLTDPILTSRTFGAGLGLPTARKIVAWHGGRIDMKQGQLGGKRVDVFLPFSVPERV